MENSKLEDETKLLKETILHLKKEIDRLRQAPLLVAEIKEVLGDTAILHLKTGNEFYVNISKDVIGLQPGDAVLVEQKNLNIVKKINGSSSFGVEKFVIMEKPNIDWSDVGGLKDTIRELQEVIELPLTKPELFEKVGIQPPKGILLHGPPGTGKTLLAKAVASATKSTFIEIVGSELVQKFIGEGAKIVKEIFQLAKQKAPAIVFIDEIDALASKRIEQGTSGEREVQRTFMQLLAELDGFKPLGNVKLIATTNRKDILDPAIIRPGRLDRLIHVKNPDFEGIKQIFKIHTKKMNLDKKIDFEKIYKLIQKEEFSGAEIHSIATESGYNAIRKKRSKIIEKDLVEAIKKVKEDEEKEKRHEMFF
ncbi:AAA family ATPase [Candidatus Woesearchaeota archaeon]|nr:AAA family ATPase [Candidatus Woesearchaeota archaeon]MBT4595450.1 AAA family ATPase [Candidatus Woesearchaeota archaeon]MBT5741165.1 AAA family ATPase [Candidatus Woesearchaeota archaeon]MBT6505931.1 AAA family ATPase [Candidatus Woesearchaeota archaeon]MBT7849716.1 AAA family ATPase [Candidatus Woesearchaeota archaeon]